MSERTWVYLYPGVDRLWVGKAENMKASSESGECASLISIGRFSARGAGWVAGMAWLRPFRLAMNDPVAPSQSPEVDTRHVALIRGRCGREPLALSGLRPVPERFAGTA